MAIDILLIYLSNNQQNNDCNTKYIYNHSYSSISRANPIVIVPM